MHGVANRVRKEHGIVRAWSEVRSREQVAQETFWLELTAPGIAAQAAPGQFVMVGFGTTTWGSPFLPRPNSIAAVRGDVIGLLVRVYGAGSRRLSALRPGDSILTLGPLGSCYEVGDARSVLCVAGGVGLAPFLLLPDWLRGVGKPVDVRVLYGERVGDAVFDLDKMRELSGLDAEVWTEDGSVGRQGRVTDGLVLDDIDLVLTCGPTPMLKAVRKMTRDAGVPCQIAVEEHMACGMGTCIGCVIETVDPDTGVEGYSLVCVDGPVFSAERLRW